MYMYMYMYIWFVGSTSGGRCMSVLFTARSWALEPSTGCIAQTSDGKYVHVYMYIPKLAALQFVVLED